MRSAGVGAPTVGQRGGEGRGTREAWGLSFVLRFGKSSSVPTAKTAVCATNRRESTCGKKEGKNGTSSDGDPLEDLIIKLEMRSCSTRRRMYGIASENYNGHVSNNFFIRLVWYKNIPKSKNKN